MPTCLGKAEESVIALHKLWCGTCRLTEVSIVRMPCSWRLTRIRLQLAIYFRLHKGDHRPKGCTGASPQKGIHGSRNSARAGAIRAEKSALRSKEIRKNRTTRGIPKRFNRQYLCMVRRHEHYHQTTIFDSAR